MQFVLRTKILLLMAGTVAGLAGLIILAMTLLNEQEVNRSVHDSAKTTETVLTEFLQERSESLLAESLMLVKPSTTLKQYLQLPDQATIRDIADDMRGQLRADAALITDRDGRLLGQTDSMENYKGDCSQLPGLLVALDGQTWTGVVARNGKLMLQVSVPVAIGPEVWGTFTSYSALDGNLAQSLRGVSNGSEVAFVARGQVMAASRDLPALLPTPQSEPTLVTLGGISYYALYAPLPHADPRAELGFVSLRPYRLTAATLARFRAALACVAAGSLLLALLAGAVVARSITRPLDGVVKAAQTVREGKWPEKFNTKRSDEIGLLQSVFDEMTSAMQSSQERLLSLIDTDNLTGLDNHRRFQERLSQEAKRCAASGESLSLLLFDLDHFSEYNHRHGHHEGDAALCRAAAILRNVLPEVAIVARYGGEEFAAILPQCDLAQAERFAERIRALMAGKSRGQDDELFGEQKVTAERPALSLSVGCAEFGTHTKQAEGLVLAAELAVSQAKQLGRNRVCRFDSVPGADENADPYQLHKFLKDSNLATIQALAAAVDAKDPYTQGHSRRVAEYACALARHIGLPAEEIELLYTTGTLHDVGKIGVPDAILKKPGRLDDDERAIMETHPALGEVIVRKAPILAPTLLGVRHHHEKWDGTGYPDNLAGEAIPHHARLLAVADTYDAMTSDRPYRKGLAISIALGEIAKGAGTQFDPTLAQAFVELMQPAIALPQAA